MKKDVYFINDKISKDFLNDRNKTKDMEFCKLQYTHDSYTFIEYYSYGKLHNENGPAKIVINNINDNVTSECYYFHGEFHREDGPAVINYHDNGNVESEFFFMHGAYDKLEYEKKTYDQQGNLIFEKTNKKQNYYTNGKLTNSIEEFKLPIGYTKFSYYDNEKLSYIKLMYKSHILNIYKNKSIYNIILKCLEDYMKCEIGFIHLINITLKDMLELNALTEKEYKELQDLSISTLTIKSLN